MVSRKPILSVVLPAYNRGDVISFAIESVLRQTEQNFELLIVGDGCTDNTAKVVKPYLKDPRIKWFDFPKAPGFGYANRNKVLKMARGKYVGLVAHDDIVLQDHFRLLITHLENDRKLDIVYSRPLWVTRDCYIIPSSFNLKERKNFKWFMTVDNAIPSSCFVIRRSCFAKVGYLNARLKSRGDLDLWRRIINIRKNNYDYEPTPTALHFLADWRDSDESSPHEKLRRPAIHYKIYPKELHIYNKIGNAEQGTFWRVISKDPLGWSKKIRAACTMLLDNCNYFLAPQIYDFVQQHNYDEIKMAKLRSLLNEYESSKTIRYRNKLYKLLRKK